MQDRVPANPGRVLITPENGGTAFYATLTRADNPTQQGDALNKNTLLNDETCEILELPYTATPNDAFRKLIIPEGKYALRVTVLSPGGLPMSGITVNGIMTASGHTAVTGSKGSVVGFTTSQSLTLTAVNNRLDISGDVSVSVSLTAEIMNTMTIQFSRGNITQATFSESTTVQFSPDVDTFDCSAIGGGRNGSNGSAYSSWASGGDGGCAGTIANKANIANDESVISIVVGAVGGNSKVGNYISAACGAGFGGADGGYIRNSKIENYASNGKDSSGFLYPPTSVGGGGGGGATSWKGYSVSAGKGGAPGGGNGGCDGTLPGSGGGGGYAITDSDGSTSEGKGGAGQPGLCGLMWRYKS